MQFNINHNIQIMQVLPKIKSTFVSYQPGYRSLFSRVRKVRTAKSNTPVKRRLLTCKEEKVPQKITTLLCQRFGGKW